MSNRNLRLALGALSGAVGLIAMLRLADGAFSGPLSAFSLVFVLLAMLPWVGYSAYRARHGHLGARAGLAVAALSVLGIVAVWLFTVGAVVALACSLAGFAIIWVHDWPPRVAKGEDRFVRIEELATDEE